MPKPIRDIATQVTPNRLKLTYYYTCVDCGAEVRHDRLLPDRFEPRCHTCRMEHKKAARIRARQEEDDQIRRDAVKAYIEAQWHKIALREPTDEERAERSDIFDECGLLMLDCVMPDDGQEVLIATKYGTTMDTYCMDEYGGYFDSGTEIEDVYAWMEIPKYECGKAV